jgi:hypothetical protein
VNKQRWLRVGLLALGLFAVNVIARVVTEVGDVTTDSGRDLVAYGGMAAVFVAVAVAGAWWAVRYPFSRIVFDVGAAVIIFALLSILVGPLFVGDSPFASGLAFIVGQILLLIAVGLVGGLLGFAATVTVGKDWKSRGLRQFEQTYHRRQNRPTRG